VEHLSISSPTVLLPFTDIAIPSAVFWMCFITLVVVGFCVAVRVGIRRFSETPTNFQNVVEFMVEGIQKFTKSVLHEHADDATASWGLTVCIFLFCAMCLELLGIRSPAADLAVTLAMGLITFFWINYMAFKVKGFKGRIKAYLKPNIFMAFIRMITDIAKPISMGCRLFGNVLAGLIVMELIYAVIPLGVPAALSIYFNLFHTAIQAYIFITLTFSFIGEAIE